MTPHLHDPVWTGLVARLRDASAKFDELWSRHDVTGSALPAKSFRSAAGDLELHATRMAIGYDALTRMTVYTPADELTAARLEQLVLAGSASPSDPRRKRRGREKGRSP